MPLILYLNPRNQVVVETPNGERLVIKLLTNHTPGVELIFDSKVEEFIIHREERDDSIREYSEYA